MEAAEALYQEALAIARTMSTSLQVVEAMVGLGRTALRRGDPQAAASRFVECISIVPRARPGQNVLLCLEGVACALILEPRPIAAPGSGTTSAAPPRLLRAARLLGAVEVVRERIGIRRPPREQSEHEGWTATLSASLGSAAFTAAWEAGRALSWQEPMACALGKHCGSGR